MELEEMKKYMFEKTSNYDLSVEEGTYIVRRKPMPRPDAVGKNERIVERAGYIPAKKQIANLLAAGERLEEYRKKMYSNEPTSDDVEPDPTMRRDYTEMDAIDDAKKVGKRLKEQAELQKKAQEDAAEAEKIVAEEQRKKLAEKSQSEKSDKDLGTPA